MVKNANQLIQAVPLQMGKINVGAGSYRAGSVIHAETDASITLDWSDGTTTPYTILAGDDRSYVGNFTVESGTVTYA